MNRSAYTDDLDDNWSLIRWRGAVSSAIRGKRGQAFLRELAAALDAMPVKLLIAGELATTDGNVCAMGCVMKQRGLDPTQFDVDDYDKIGEAVGISPALVREIEYENDEIYVSGNDAVRADLRWRYVRKWVEDHLSPPAEQGEAR